MAPDFRSWALEWGWGGVCVGVWGVCVWLGVLGFGGFFGMGEES